MSSMVVYFTPRGKWRGQVRHNGTSYHVGIFGSREAAEAACREEIARVETGTSALVRGNSITISRFASEIGVRQGTVKRWVHEGMPIDKDGIGIRIVREEAKAWIEANRSGSVAFSRKSTVYVAQRATDGAVKIGWTSDVHRRMKELAQAIGNDVVLVAALPGDKVIELQLHAEFAASRLDGEWFAASVDDVVQALREAA